MSVIRHAQIFERKTFPNGSTRWFRPCGKGENVLLLAGEDIRPEIERQLQENFFEVRLAVSLPEALRFLRDENYNIIIVDSALGNFPLDLFLFAIEKLSPALAERVIFLVGAGLDARWADLIERSQGVKVWRVLEMQELFEAVERVLSIEQNRSISSEVSRQQPTQPLSPSPYSRH